MTDPAPAPAAAWPAMTIAQAHALLTAPGSPLEMEEVVIRGIPTRVWKNAPPTLRSVVETGRGFGERIFLVHEDERVSFEAFFRAVAALAQELAARGVVKGDRVAIAMRNLPEWPVAFYAAACLGAHRHPPERLVDRAGAGIRPDKLRFQGRLPRCRTPRTRVRAPAQLPGAGARLCQPRGR